MSLNDILLFIVGIVRPEPYAIALIKTGHGMFSTYILTLTAMLVYALSVLALICVPAFVEKKTKCLKFKKYQIKFEKLLKRFSGTKLFFIFPIIIFLVNSVPYVPPLIPVEVPIILVIKNMQNNLRRWMFCVLFVSIMTKCFLIVWSLESIFLYNLF